MIKVSNSTSKSTKQPFPQEAGRDVRGGGLGGAATLESLDDPAYRGLPDLGYSSRQTSILDTFHTHLLLPPSSSSCARAGSRRATTLSSWTRTCTLVGTWTWSWRLEGRGSWRRSRRGVEQADGRKVASCLHSWRSHHRLFLHCLKSQLKAIFSGASVVTSPCPEDGLLPVPWPRPSDCPVPS